MTKRQAAGALGVLFFWVMLIVGACLLVGCTSGLKCSCEALAGEECVARAECTEEREVVEPPIKPIVKKKKNEK